VNRSFTFKAKNGNTKKQFVAFTVVTLFGLWAIQPIVILATSALLASTGWEDTLILFVAKLIATVASLIWNYLFYSKFVFKVIAEEK
jgi:putative flippase GtrA